METKENFHSNSEIVKLYFNQLPTIDFGSVEKKLQEAKRKFDQFDIISFTNWLEDGCRKRITSLLNFIKSNNNLLCPKRSNFNYQGYLNILEG